MGATDRDGTVAASMLIKAGEHESLARQFRDEATALMIEAAHEQEREIIIELVKTLCLPAVAERAVVEAIRARGAS